MWKWIKKLKCLLVNTKIENHKFHCFKNLKT